MQKLCCYKNVHIKNWKMHSTESRKSGHCDTNLETLPAKSVLLSTLLIPLYDEYFDEMFALSDSKGVSHSQSVDPDQSRTATLFEKLEQYKKKQSASVKQSKQVGRLTGA